MQQITRDKLGNNPFNMTNGPIHYIKSEYDNEVKYKHTILLGLLILPSKASNLLLYMTNNLEVGKDYVHLDNKDYMSSENIKSRVTAKSAVDELIKRSYINPTGKRGWYWINPHKIIKL